MSSQSASSHPSPQNARKLLSKEPKDVRLLAEQAPHSLLKSITSDRSQVFGSLDLGKVIGVRHGAPTEGMTYAQIRDLLGEITDYPQEYNDFAAAGPARSPPLPAPQRTKAFLS